MVADQPEGGLVGVVEPLPSDMPADRPDVCGVLPAPRRAALRARQVPLSGGQPAGGPDEARRVRLVLAVVENGAIPTSTPTTAPVVGSGSAGTSSQDRMTYQRLPSHLTLTVLTLPSTVQYWWTLT